MDRKSSDKMLLQAQELINSDSSDFFSKMDSYLPLVFIVIVGLVVTSIALFSAKQWENHIEYNITKSKELAYLNEINRNLFNMKQNTNVMAGLVESSKLIDESEFNTFSHRLLKNQLTTQFISILNYKGYDYLQSDRPKRNDYIIQNTKDFLERFSDRIMEKSNKDAYFILDSDEINGRNYVVHMLMIDSEDKLSPIVLISGIHSATLIEGINDKKPLFLNLDDSFGNDDKLFFNNAQASDGLHSVSHFHDELKITLGIDASLSNLESAAYLKWILISFSIAFTLALCIQFMLTKRSMKNLANLAAQRANDLTSINSSLAEEIMNRIEFQSELLRKNEEIQEINDQLEEAHNQLIQQEKLASLGQLAAGVAHEINNPVGFITSNLTMLKKYTNRSLSLLDYMGNAISSLNSESLSSELEEEKEKHKFKTIDKNMLAVIDESLEGLERVKRIVQDLKNFSRIDDAEWQWADIHSGIESTLNIAWNEIKYKAEIHKDFGDVPNIECVPSQLNQVFMNLFVNSAQAIKDNTGNIYIRTHAENNHVVIQIEDDGCGIPESQIGKIFDPFFTTKEVGKGTGLGLSLSYGIIKKHNGDLTVKSTLGKGAVFTIKLPVSRINTNMKAG